MWVSATNFTEPAGHVPYPKTIAYALLHQRTGHTRLPLAKQLEKLQYLGRVQYIEFSHPFPSFLPFINPRERAGIVALKISQVQADPLPPAQSSGTSARADDFHQCAHSQGQH